MDLSVITVTWNSKENITEQISSVILGSKQISFEQIIVDNGSTDDTVSIVETHCNASLRLIKNATILGFPAANNHAAALARGEFILFLNPDMRVEEGSLDKLLNWMREHPDVGIAGCKLVDAQGKFKEKDAPRRFPTLLNQLAIILKLPHLLPSLLDKYLYKGFNPDKEQEVDSVRGSFLIMRHELYKKLGFAFDPRYFIWFEDVDLCREAKRLNYKVIYAPIVSCVDQVGASFSKRNFLWKQFQFTKSMIKYFLKWW